MLRKLALALAVLAVAPGLAAAAGELRGTPDVIDGNTLEIDGRRLTLQGIDAPELGQSCRLHEKPYDCGEISRAALLDLTAGSEVVCRPASAGAARCFADDYDLAAGMVYTGWALAEREAGARYVKTEQGARDGKRGLWRGDFVAPWEWRQGRRLDAEATPQ